MKRHSKPVSVEAFYVARQQEGRAVLREKRGDAVVWIIRAKVLGEWQYALCTEDGGLKRLVATVDITVIEAGLPRFRPTTGKDYGTSLATIH